MAAPQLSGQIVIDTSSSGDTTLVAAPNAPGFIRVLHYRVTAAAATVVKFKSGSLVVDVVQATTVAGSGVVTPLDAMNGVLDCEPGQPLVVNNSNAVAIGGCVKYVVKGVG